VSTEMKGLKFGSARGLW